MLGNLPKLQVTNVKLTEVAVGYGDSEMSRLLSRGIARAMFCINSDRASALWDDEDACYEEIHSYRLTQLYKVLECINNDGQLKDFRKWSNLLCFAWDVNMFSNVGILVDSDYGLKIVPKMKDEEFQPLSYSDMADISFKLDMWRNLGIGLFTDWIPKTSRTTSAAMNFVLIGDYLNGRYKDESNILLGYISAFLDAQVISEEMNNLFMIRYNSADTIVENIRGALTDLIKSHSGEVKEVKENEVPKSN